MNVTFNLNFWYPPILKFKLLLILLSKTDSIGTLQLNQTPHVEITFL